MRKGFVAVLVLGLLLVAAVPALAANGLNAGEGGMNLGQGVTRAYIAELLRLDLEELRSSRREGMSMIAIAESKGMTADTLVNAIVELRTGQLENLVAEGTISAEKAEQCIETMADRILANLERVPEAKHANMENRQIRQQMRLQR